MSYTRKPMSGIQSRAYGSRVATRALAGIQSRQSASRVASRALGGLLDSIDPPFPPPFVGPVPDPNMDQGTWNAAMLGAIQNQSLWMESWVRRDQTQRWMQLAATVSIPLFALIWKAILHRRAPISL
ncbi:MAG TPA: hypothetical protein VGM94_00640 [Galbitalea sp.]|jgi:hypothetical protein